MPSSPDTMASDPRVGDGTFHSENAAPLYPQVSIFRVAETPIEPFKLQRSST